MLTSACAAITGSRNEDKVATACEPPKVTVATGGCSDDPRFQGTYGDRETPDPSRYSFRVDLEPLVYRDGPTSCLQCMYKRALVQYGAYGHRVYPPDTCWPDIDIASLSPALREHLNGHTTERKVAIITKGLVSLDMMQTVIRKLEASVGSPESRLGTNWRVSDIDETSFGTLIKAEPERDRVWVQDSRKRLGSITEPWAVYVPSRFPVTLSCGRDGMLEVQRCYLKRLDPSSAQSPRTLTERYPATPAEGSAEASQALSPAAPAEGFDTEWTWDFETDCEVSLRFQNSPNS